MERELAGINLFSLFFVGLQDICRYHMDQESPNYDPQA